MEKKKEMRCQWTLEQTAVVSLSFEQHRTGSHAVNKLEW